MCKVHRCIQPSVASVPPPLVYIRGGHITHTSPCSCILSDGVSFHDSRTHLGKESATIKTRDPEHENPSYQEGASRRYRGFAFAVLARNRAHEPRIQFRAAEGQRTAAGARAGRSASKRGTAQLVPAQRGDKGSLYKIASLWVCSPLPSLNQQFYIDDHLFVDLRHELVTLDGETVRLTPIQYRLLGLLVQHGGVVVTRPILLMQIWGHAPQLDPRQVDMHICGLGRKLGVYAKQYIETVVGTGCRFRPIPRVLASGPADSDTPAT